MIIVLTPRCSDLIGKFLMECLLIISPIKVFLMTNVFALNRKDGLNRKFIKIAMQVIICFCAVLNRYKVFTYYVLLSFQNIDRVLKKTSVFLSHINRVLRGLYSRLIYMLREGLAAKQDLFMGWDKTLKLNGGNGN